MTEYTFVLNLEDASSSTYQTWVTVRVRNGILERKSNASGNGQTWELFGYVSKSEAKLFSTKATETQQARIVAHVVKSVGLKCNVGGFGVAWRNATVVEATVSTQTGRKLTAAPSVRLGHVDRDKNVNQMRLKVATIDMAAAMAERKRDEAYDAIVESAVARHLAARKRIVFFTPRLTVEAGVEVNADTMRRLA